MTPKQVNNFITKEHFLSMQYTSQSQEAVLVYCRQMLQCRITGETRAMAPR